MPTHRCLRHATLAALLLLGACSTSVDLLVPAPSAQPDGATPATTVAAGELLRSAKGSEVAASEGTGGPRISVAALPADRQASDPGDLNPADPLAGGAAAALAGIKDRELRFPEPSPELLAAITPDHRSAARAVATRPAGTEVGYLLIDLETGIELAALNPDRPLIPASTAKLATAVTALDVLGPEHRYRTELLRAGPINDGVLRGDLILRGGGDPALDVADLLELAVRLESSGVLRVDGRFVIDDGALPVLSEIAPGQPLEAAYNPGLGALSLGFNRVRVRWRGGGRIQAATLPPLEEARFEPAAAAQLPPGGVELKAVDGATVVWRIADRNRFHARWLPVKDPGLHAGRVFRHLVSAQGVLLPPPRRGPVSTAATVLAVHRSPPLKDLLRAMLLNSNNMMAEMIGLTTAARLGDVSSGLDAAGALLIGHLARLMPAVDWRRAQLGNTSGLDGDARLTPRQLAEIARFGWRTALPSLLPGGGWSGTLADRFDGTGERLRVWAKTGQVNYGSALAGYVFPNTARPAVFAAMVSDVSARRAYDGLLPHPDSSAEGAAGGWNARAQKLQDDLVEGWLEPIPTS